MTSGAGPNSSTVLARAFRDLHISIDTFVGAAQQGKVQPGPHGNSGVLGLLLCLAVKPGFNAPNRGTIRSLIHRASIYVLVNHLKSRGVEITRVRERPHAFRRGEPLNEWIEDAGALVEAIIAIASIIDIEAIVLDSILPRPIHLELLAKVQKSIQPYRATGIVAPWRSCRASLAPRLRRSAPPCCRSRRCWRPTAALMIGKDRTKLLGKLSALAGQS